MKRIRDFILEQRDVSYSEKRHNYHDEISYDLEHSKQISPDHELVVSHSVTRDKHGNRYIDTDFGINGHTQAHNLDIPMTGEQKEHSLRVVHKSITDVIQYHKPYRLSMYGNTDEKEGIYHEYGKKLAAKHDGKVQLRNGIVHVTFPGNKVLPKKKTLAQLKESIEPHEFEVAGRLISHRTKVHGHSVKTQFIKMSGDKEIYDVGFTVNGEYSGEKNKGKIPLEHGLAIAGHVRNVVKSFVKHFKPESLEYNASDVNVDAREKKDELYRREGERLSPKGITRYPSFTSVKLRENAGDGNIAGLGVGPQGEPGVKKTAYKKQNEKDTETIFNAVQRRLSQPLTEIKKGKFAGNDTFIVPQNVYHRALHQKAKGVHWTKYLDEDHCGRAIREFANKNPNKPIILEDEKTGYLSYARYGKKK